MIDKYNWKGTWTIKVKRNGKNLKTYHIDNHIMNAALDELVKPLLGESPDIEIKYLAIGSGTTPITSLDTTLDTEVDRFPLTSVSTGLTGEVTSTFIIVGSEGVGTINEIGVFGGSSATGSADSGLMISRILWNFEKQLGDELQFIRVDQLGRG